MKAQGVGYDMSALCDILISRVCGRWHVRFAHKPLMSALLLWSRGVIDFTAMQLKGLRLRPLTTEYKGLIPSDALARGL